jgi:hypothetical protein
MLRKSTVVFVLALLPAEFAAVQYTGAVPGTGGFDDQQFYWNMLPSGKRERSQADIDLERRYQETLKTRIPDRKPSKDPWAGIRSTTSRAEDRHRPQ